MAQIIKETVRDFRHGLTNVGTTRIPLTNSMPALKGVYISTPGPWHDITNTAPVFVGGPGVTADSEQSAGLPIMPGGSLFVPIADPSLLWVVSTADNQQVTWLLT